MFIQFPKAKKSLFGDVPDLDDYAAIILAMNIIERKDNLPPNRC